MCQLQAQDFSTKISLSLLPLDIKFISHYLLKFYPKVYEVLFRTQKRWKIYDDCPI